MDNATEMAERSIEKSYNFDGVWFHSNECTFLCGRSNNHEVARCREKCGWYKPIGQLPDADGTPVKPPFCPLCWILEDETTRTITRKAKTEML